jgi:hypothetical protein
MPEKCPDCNFESEHGFCLAKSPDFCGYTDELVRPDWCPLVDLGKHGRLVDADALIQDHFSPEHRIALSEANKAWMRKIINDAQTIVESKDGT